ncbi:MAG: NAD(P)H-hydrate epimerase [Planctomycetota bacterium]|nr:NAD(P)H-hydrate epimerase [Planctomycetota bacterium]
MRASPCGAGGSPNKVGRQIPKKSRSYETDININIVRRLKIPILEAPWLLLSKTCLPRCISGHRQATVDPVRSKSPEATAVPPGAERTSNGVKKQWNKLLRILQESDIIIDAIFGIGLQRQIQEPLEGFIEMINSLNIPVVAVDIPSGIDTDTGRVFDTAIRAKVTVTFGFPKKGFLNKTARKYLGKLVVADISIPPGCGVPRKHSGKYLLPQRHQDTKRL